MKKMSNDAFINFRVPSKLKQDFIEKCENKGKKYQQKIKELMQEYVDMSIAEVENKEREKYLHTERLL